MKKILVLMLCMAAIASMSGCGKKAAKPEATPAPTPTAQIVENGAISATEEDGKVKVVLPASVFGEDIEEAVESVKVNRGFENAAIGDNATVTFTMTKEQHEEWKADAAESAKISAEAIISDDRYLGMKEVTFNEDYTEANIVTAKAVYKSERDSVAAEGVANSVFFYQSISGKNAEELKCTVNFIDEASGEILETVVFPEA